MVEEKKDVRFGDWHANDVSIYGRFLDISTAVFLGLGDLKIDVLRQTANCK